MCNECIFCECGKENPLVLPTELAEPEMDIEDNPILGVYNNELTALESE